MDDNQTEPTEKISPIGDDPRISAERRRATNPQYAALAEIVEQSPVSHSKAKNKFMTITAIVLHATPPNFLGLVPTEQSTYHWVARKTFDVLTDKAGINDEDILEELFHQTNSIERAWFELAENRGLAVKLDTCSMPTPQRSTSVGDVIHIHDVFGDRYFLCQMVGWTLVDESLIQQS